LPSRPASYEVANENVRQAIKSSRRSITAGYNFQQAIKFGRLLILIDCAVRQVARFSCLSVLLLWVYRVVVEAAECKTFGSFAVAGQKAWLRVNFGWLAGRLKEYSG
jgi:hypothetical protein